MLIPSRSRVRFPPTQQVIKFSKYFWAHIVAIMGIWICIMDSPYPIWYAFFGAYFVGVGLKLARQHGSEEKEKKQ